MEIGSQFARAPAGTISVAPYTLHARALALWPRLDRRKLTRCGGDPRRIAALISHRTRLSRPAIVAMLLGTAVNEGEIETWFG